MSLRIETLQVARLAPKLLGESTDLVEKFLRQQIHPAGGFKDRTGKSDLYYTVFGIDSLIALHSELPLESLQTYLHTFKNGQGLDFVHLCCLARAWSAVSNPLSSSPTQTAQTIPPTIKSTILKRLESHRSSDGGYHPNPAHPFGTVYAAFLALGACQDLKSDLPDQLQLVQSLKFLETNDGAWANERNLKIGSTNATAAAVSLLRHLQQPVNPRVGDWLLARAHPQGGFVAAPDTPIPDLLSTATALHALAGLERSFEFLKESCLDFIDTLWTNRGGFFGYWNDDTVDCEYLFYGLLALGHLAL